MFIVGIGVATPPQRFTQRECWDALQTSPQFPRLTPRSRAMLKKVLAEKTASPPGTWRWNRFGEVFV